MFLRCVRTGLLEIHVRLPFYIYIIEVYIHIVAFEQLHPLFYALSEF